MSPLGQKNFFQLQHILKLICKNIQNWSTMPPPPYHIYQRFILPGHAHFSLRWLRNPKKYLLCLCGGLPCIKTLQYWIMLLSFFLQDKPPIWTWLLLMKSAFPSPPALEVYTEIQHTILLASYYDSCQWQVFFPFSSNTSLLGYFEAQWFTFL